MQPQNRTDAPQAKTPKLRALTPMLVMAGLVASGPALAGDEIFLRLDGITGGATAAGHVGEIVISTYSQAFSNTASSGTGSGGGAGKAMCGAITVMKNIDKSSPFLISNVVRGSRIATGDIKFDRTNAGGLVEFYHVALQEIVITDIAQMDHAPAGVMEQVTLSPT
jgi:type VI secretion system secreted protein Hcp